MAKKNSGPVNTIQVGTVRISIWENQFDDGVSYSYVLSKNYLDKKTNEWKSTGNLKANELAMAIRALQLAFDSRYVKVENKDNEDF